MAEQRPTTVGEKVFVRFTVIRCAECNGLRYDGLVCLPCDLPGEFVADHTDTWDCNCWA